MVIRNLKGGGGVRGSILSVIDLIIASANAHRPQDISVLCSFRKHTS